MLEKSILDQALRKLELAQEHNNHEVVVRKRKLRNRRLLEAAKLLVQLDFDQFKKAFMINSKYIIMTINHYAKINPALKHVKYFQKMEDIKAPAIMNRSYKIEGQKAIDFIESAYNFFEYASVTVFKDR